MCCGTTTLEVTAMKLDKWICALWAFLLSFGLSLAAAMCMTSAFDFYIDTAVLVRCCAIASLLGSVCYSLPLGFVPLGAAALGIGWLWKESFLLSSLDAILNRLSRRYDSAYGWGIVRMSVRTPEEMEPDLLWVLCILSCAIALLISWSVCRKRTQIPGLTVSILTLIPCFVVNDSVPDTGWLYLYFCCFIVLILTGSVRRKSTREGNRLCLIVAPITALVILFLFAVTPQSSYNRQAQAEKLTAYFMESDFVQLLLGHTGSGGDPTADGKTVDLKTVGYRVETHIQTLEATAPFTGTLYLRGRAMDLYDGVTWTDSENYYISLTWPSYHLDNVGEVKISTRFAHPMLYIPYYANITDMRNVTLGIANEEKLTDYSFACRQLPQGNYLSQLQYDNTDLSLLSSYIDLDIDVQRWAQPLAKKLCGGTKNPYQMAQSIASYVRNSATYSSMTPRMPGSKTDFARWFLEDSDTGYCVHFATAATVLLQAAGIPARYVTGYMTQVVKDEPVTVYADQAHAWAEYWLPGFGWAILDATPADYGQPQQETTEATTSPATTETQAQEESSPTQPSNSPIGGVDTPTTPKEELPVEKTVSITAIVRTLLPILLWAVAIASIPLLIIGQRQLRLRYKQRKLVAAACNEKALLYWQQITLLCKLLKETPEEKLFLLAQRAKFSQHTLTEKELAEFTARIALLTEKLQQKNLLLRLYYRYVLALY